MLKFDSDPEIRAVDLLFDEAQPLPISRQFGAGYWHVTVALTPSRVRFVQVLCLCAAFRVFEIHLGFYVCDEFLQVWGVTVLRVGQGDFRAAYQLLQYRQITCDDEDFICLHIFHCEIYFQVTHGSCSFELSVSKVNLSNASDNAHYMQKVLLVKGWRQFDLNCVDRQLDYYPVGLGTMQASPIRTRINSAIHLQLPIYAITVMFLPFSVY